MSGVEGRAAKMGASENESAAGEVCEECGGAVAGAVKDGRAACLPCTSEEGAGHAVCQIAAPPAENGGTLGRTRQTPESIQSDFDRIALLAEEGWDHNAHYHRHLLSHVPERCWRVLEIGCGAGEFTRLLAARARRVLALDLSPQMIRRARERSGAYPNVEFVAADAMAYPLADGQFDCVASVAALHHLPAESILRKIKKALTPGGVFVCLDLYRRSGPRELLFDGAAYPASLLLTLMKTGRPVPPRQVREAYAEHGKTDTYLTLPQVEQVCAEIMPGACVTRHLFWRYSVVWRKEAAA